jgi:predicted metal-dependent HD superfamily phosphohydrolase
MFELDVSEPLSKAAWRDIAAGYRAPNRHYHTLKHIDYVLERIDRFGSHLLMPGAVRMAAIYHDARDTEEDSAELARRALHKFGLPAEWCSVVPSLVMCTKTHKPLDGLLNADSAILSDCDLLILGTPARSYDAYTRKVRLEWPQYDDAEFRAGRKKVMEQFVQRTPIYFTPEIRACYEARALANLRREIASL